ncbi:MAG TPA: alpha/beta fold hydrolase [Acidimicrobiales bacterium]|nr:alpha/beta fold hydrolase [Acidimicrobiales bacterium]
MALHVERTGSGSPLVLVHGFTQNAQCWGRFAAELGAHEVICVDAPGHGRSGHADADLTESGRLIGEAAGRATYLGYSMGGRMCLHLALERPDLVERLILIGSTAGIDDADERAARRTADERLARRLDTEPLPDFLDDWLALGLFAGIADADQHRAERLANDPAGLAASLRNSGTGTQEPLWERLGGLSMPVLLLAGAHDDKFAALAHRMADSIGPNATVRIVDGAGHAVHLERPAETWALVSTWLGALR